MVKIRMVMDVELDTENAERMTKYLHLNMNSAIEVGLLDFDGVEVNQYSFDVEEVSDAE